jgi:hypothetical protein
MGGMNKSAELENLKGLSSEIGWAENGIIRQISFKGRGAGICNWFRLHLLQEVSIKLYHFQPNKSRWTVPLSQ